jgi:hypothetical protein
MKQAYIEATFPDLLVKDAYQTGRGRGSSSRIAISRAVGDLLKKVSKKRVSTIKATISITDVMEENDADNQ